MRKTKKATTSTTGETTVKPAYYLRVSTTEQALDGYGLASQRAKCDAMATIKGWNGAIEYADEGISGTKDETERPGLSALLDAVASGAVNAVIVSSLDRLGRAAGLVLRIVEMVETGGAALVSCKESLDTSTPSGRFALTIFAAIAQLDRENIVERTTAGRNERGKIDGERGGRLPYGYVRAETIAIDHTAAATVRRMFAMRAAGATLTAIADTLNSDAIAPRHGQRWYASTVREVLGNEASYRGGYRGESTQRWPSIIA